MLDPFAEEGDPFAEAADVGSQEDYIHIRIQQRNGRKTLTTLQGLPKSAWDTPFDRPSANILSPVYDAKKLLKTFKKVGS